MKIKIKKLNENAKIPYYQIAGDAGLDLTATSKKYNITTDSYIYGTGLSIEIPRGYVGYLFSRSSIYKRSLYLSNSVGVIDSNFRNEIKVIFKRISFKEHGYEIGDRIAQLIIMPIPHIEFVESDTLSDTERSGGFGSTGK